MKSESDRVRWGLIGCGDIARKRVARALRDSASSELVSVSRSNRELLESFAREFNARKWFADWRELITDSEIDAVYVATPVHLHAEQTVAALNTGKHVLCEKPMALNVAECDRMIAAAYDNKLKLGVAYYRHFYPVVRRVKELMHSGTLGQPVVAQVNAFEWFNPTADHPRSWLLKKELSGGGPMFDFGCHRIEVLLELFGPVAKVKGLSSRALFDREVEDTAVAVFEFNEGVMATLTVSHAVREPQDTLSVWCSEGSIHIPVLNQATMIVRSGESERVETHPPAGNLHQPLIEDFVAAVLADREPVVTGTVGRMVAIVEEQIDTYDECSD